MDRNTISPELSRPCCRSLSARRAWIEIRRSRLPGTKRRGSLSARRAWIEIRSWFTKSPPSRVALRKESVDRNILSPISEPCEAPSLSARRAWIEIQKRWTKLWRDASLSARRAWIEIQAILVKVVLLPSLSARRAWIEIGCWLPDHSWWLRRSPQGERG